MAERRFIIFRNGSIGNTLAAVPAIRALRKSLPNAHVAVVVDSVGNELLKFCPYVNELVVYDKRGGDRGAVGFLRVLSQLRRIRPTHAVLFKRFFRNGLLAYLSGAKVRAGFRTNGKAPFLNLTTDYDETIHVVELNLRLVSLLGVSSQDRKPEFFLGEEDRNEAATELKSVGDSPFVAVHYGGVTSSPDFLSIDRFCELLRHVSANGQKIVLLGHGERELQYANKISERVPVTLVIGVPIRTAAAIIERSRLFMGFNSGPMHIAASLNKPGVVFFRPDDKLQTELDKWKPLSDKIVAMIPPASKDSSAEWAEFMDKAIRSVREKIQVS